MSRPKKLPFQHRPREEQEAAFGTGHRDCCDFHPRGEERCGKRDGVNHFALALKHVECTRGKAHKGKCYDAITCISFVPVADQLKALRKQTKKKAEAQP
jgi:hypothetical protein